MKKIGLTVLFGFIFSNNLEEKVEFISANPFSFYHIITDLENQTRSPEQKPVVNPENQTNQEVMERTE